MTDSTNTPVAPEGFTLDTVKTKTTMEDGTKRELSASVALPTAATLAAILTGDNKELKEQAVECHALGINSRVRNHINAGRTASYDVVMPEDVVAMTAEAAEGRANQGAALVAFRAAVAVVVQVAEASGYSSAACGKIKKLVSNTTALTMASAAHKARIIQLLEAVGNAVSEEDMVEIAAPLGKMLEAASTEEDDDF